MSLFIQQATSIAIHMVKDWGMSERVGLRTHDGNSSGLVVVNDLSPSTSDLIDAEIKRILTVSLSLLINIVLKARICTNSMTVIVLECHSDG
jgi:ATP-dependent Zn protease